MKKTVSLIILLLVVMMTLNSFAADVKMTDIDYSSELGKSVEKLVKAEVISGIPQPDGTLKYEPDKPVTRAEFCKMVNVTFGFEIAANNIFPDVNPKQWYYIYVLPAIHYGYIAGYGDGRFGGEDFITREQVCAILSRILEKELDKKAEGDKKVEITDKVSSWAKSYVENIVALGYIPLEEGGKFRATENMTRGELAFALDDFVVVKEEVKEDKEEDKTGSSGSSKPSSGSSRPSSGGSSRPSSGGSSRPSGGSSSSGSGSSSSGSGSSSSGDDSSSSGSGSSTGGSSTGGTTTPEPEPEPEPEVEYTITYELGGIGELTENARTTFKASSPTFTLPVLKGTDMEVFDGWYKDSSFEGEPVKKVETGTAENLVFYACWKPRYTEEELQKSADIYSSLEFALTDIYEKEELEVFEFDEKGLTIFNHLKNCSTEVYTLQESGVIVSNNYVRGKYQEEIKEITTILDGMTTEERDAFEFEINKLNTVVVKDLVELFDVNINYGKE